jgi:hypothetical protein
MSDLPTLAEPYVIAEEFCGDCGESIGYDVRPFTVRCEVCQAIFDAQARRRETDHG